MPPARRIYLDTNILIKLVEQEDADSVLLRQIVTSAGQSDSTRFCTSELSRAEVLVAPIRNNDDNLIAVYYNVLADGGTLKVGPITSDITGIAAKLRALHKSLKLPDAIHVATALAFGCTHLLTADTRLKNVYHLPPDPKFAASSHVYVSQHSLEIIRPDQPTLTGLLAEFAD